MYVYYQIICIMLWKIRSNPGWEKENEERKVNIFINSNIKRPICIAWNVFFSFFILCRTTRGK